MEEKNRKYKLYLADYCLHTTAFPTEPAAVLWLQGCCRKCPGCMAPLWQESGQGHQVEPCKLAWDIISEPGLKMVVISGGEPLLQVKALSVLVQELKQNSKLVLLLYTGYREEELQQDYEKLKLARAFDITIFGPYIKKLNEGKGFRGSSNQVVQIYNPNYDYLRQILEFGSRKAEIEVGLNQVRIIGIPPKSLDHNRLS
jgi:anaerobic ribonucleoside-triphosphate reductase activating protein